jgi:hypothetical protein
VKKKQREKKRKKKTMYNKERTSIFGRRGMNEEKTNKDGKRDGNRTRQEEIKPQ